MGRVSFYFNILFHAKFDFIKRRATIRYKKDGELVEIDRESKLGKYLKLIVLTIPGGIFGVYLILKIIVGLFFSEWYWQVYTISIPILLLILLLWMILSCFVFLPKDIQNDLQIEEAEHV
ncbi:MAG: hypothetical protein GX778_06095 [Erysipelothrix sp.]|nr:hypothetical protein [Erysipelothrix sp.]